MESMEYTLSQLINLLQYIIIIFVLPFLSVLPNFVGSFFFFTYKWLNKHRSESTHLREFWDKPLSWLAGFWYYFGRIIHGYEIEGMNKIPDSGPAIIVCYHAETPIDAAFFLSEVLFKKKRKIIQIVDHIAFKLPGYKTFLEASEQTTGTVDSLVDVVNNNELVAIYPGGLKEAIFGDNSYPVIWRPNAGFAKVAVRAQVPVIPVFTKNSRQMVGRLNWFKEYFENLYITKKISYLPIFGWFPVKLKTFVGDPIYYDESRSVEELVEITKKSLEAMIKQHQRLPGSIFWAIVDRFYTSPLKTE